MTDRELAKEIITEIRREHRQWALRFTLEPGGRNLVMRGDCC